MIKNWFIIIFASILMTITLLMVNLMLLINSDLLINYFKQKMRIILVDSCINDFFKSINIIVDNSISHSNGNFSIMRKILEEEIREFMERVTKTKSFLEKCGLRIHFEKSVIFYNSTDKYIVEVIAEVNAEDYEGLFSIKRSNKIVRVLYKEACKELEITNFSE